MASEMKDIVLNAIIIELDTTMIITAEMGYKLKIN